MIYLPSSEGSKEDLAKEIMRKDGIEKGLVCIFTAVEPCTSVDLHRNRKEKKVELVFRRRKCLHVYQYWIDPILGFMNARIQTWFPFTVQICINGREWLSRQMNKARIPYIQQDNCFSKIADIKKTQRLMNSQLRTNWPKLLGGIAGRLNPSHDEIFKNFPIDYSRKLRMLRAHGLIKKVPHTHRYHVTEKGRSIISALMAARNADANQLTKLAA